ncbi:MAG: hypothetical protein ACLRQV_24910 [Hungatella sp.]|uniref:hypothetical protein n=1 Tax=Hungatella TaxID=1649459 RepID=UPI0012EC0C72|nr:hypothetical protein [Hungatella effluvii]
MDRKEEHAMALQSAQARAAKQEYILKGPRPETHSATMPAYCYTAMCPDPELREPIWRKGGCKADESGNSGANRKGGGPGSGKGI